MSAHIEERIRIEVETTCIGCGRSLEHRCHVAAEAARQANCDMALAKGMSQAR